MTFGEHHSSCEVIRRRIEALFDCGDACECDSTVVEHLNRCSSCHDYHRYLESVQQDLRSLPKIQFPDASLRAVLAQTVNVSSASNGGFYWRRWVKPLAAAAVLAIAVAIPWTTWQFQQAADQEQVRRAVSQARYVLGVTSGAFQRAEAAALEEIYGAHLSPALKRFQVDWATAPFSSSELGE